MSLKLSHIAIANSKIESIAEKLKVLSLEIETIHEVPSEKVRAAMLPCEVSEHFRIELLEPTSPESPISKFLTNNPKGGIHHISFEVTDLLKWEALLKKSGMEVIAPGIRIAARGKALFIHPKSTGGILVELEEILN